MKDFLKLFESSPIILFECEDINSWRIKFITPNVKSLILYNKEELENNFSYLDLLTSKDRKIIKEKLNNAINENKNNFNLPDHKLKRKNSDDVWVKTNVNITKNEYGGILNIIGYIIDITDEKKIESSLLETKEKYRVISESTVDGIFVLNKLGNMIFVNQGMINLTGRSIDNLTGVHFSKYVPKSELPRYILTLKDVFFNKEIKNFSTRIIHESGKLLDVEINGKLVQQNGQWVAQGSMRDISLRKKILKNLEYSEEKFRIMFEDNPMPTLYGDFSLLEKYFTMNNSIPNLKTVKDYSKFLKILDANKTAIELYEVKNKTMLLNNITRKDSFEFYKKVLIQLFELWNQNKKFNNFVLESGIKTFKGSNKKILETYNKLPKIKGKDFQFLISLEDLTEREKIEQAVIRNQRLNTLGEMASSVAHDFNNSLQAILNNLELILLDNEIKSNNLKHLNIIKTLILDASNRVKLIQRFGGKKEAINYYKINTKELIEDVVSQVEPLWKTNSQKNGISIIVDIECYKNSYILGNKNELHTVIHNIIKNSIEAMPKGGKITFICKKEKDYISILIKDTGIGMDKNTKKKVFQAFYSTKGFQLGRGLGMSGVYRIIKEHNGNIDVLESLVNKGTTLKIKLPIYDDNKEIKNEAKKENNDTKIKKNQEKLKILWVDDEEIVIKPILQFLRIKGYDADIAISGHEALELMETKEYNLIVTDIGMPIMNGWELIENIRKLYNKDINIIVISGWDMTSNDKKNEYNIFKTLEKPIDFKNLENILNSL